MKLTIIGASGHGKVIADIAVKNGYDEIEFLDDADGITSCGTYPVVGSTNDAAEVKNDIFVAIGNNEIRQKFLKLLFMNSAYVPTLIHPNAVIADDVVIGKGTVVMAGAVINPNATIGNGCIINTASSVDHDCKIGDYVHVSVGSHVCGTVTVGNNTCLGAGSTVINNVNICSDCVIGAGAVVIRSVLEKGTYFGVPAKCQKQKFLKIMD